MYFVQIRLCNTKKKQKKKWRNFSGKFYTIHLNEWASSSTERGSSKMLLLWNSIGFFFVVVVHSICGSCCPVRVFMWIFRTIYFVSHKRISANSLSATANACFTCATILYTIVLLFFRSFFFCSSSFSSCNVDVQIAGWLWGWFMLQRF